MTPLRSLSVPFWLLIFSGVWVLLLLPGGAVFVDPPESPACDFSQPQTVFATTLQETVVTPDIAPAALHAILQAGQLVLVNENPANSDLPWLTTAGILVQAPPDQVYDVIQDVDRYPEFMPQTESTRKEAVTEAVDRVFYELGIKILFLKVKVPYSVYHYNRPPHRVDWVMADGDFDCNYGAYEVVPVPGKPGQTLLFYTSYALPRNRVVKMFFDKIPSLDMMINLSTGILVVKAIKQRAENLVGRDKPEAGGEPSLLPGTLPVQYSETLAAMAGRGELVLLEDTDPMYYTGGVVIDRHLTDVYRDMRHLEGPPSISRHYSMKILEENENTARVRMRTVFHLMIDFDAEVIADYVFQPPDRCTWTGRDGGDVEGVAGCWKLTALGEEQTLLWYRNTSDLKSQGFLMRRLLKIEPTFEQAIQACQTMYVVSDTRKYCEASADERQKMAAED